MASVSIILILFLTAVAFLFALFINPSKRWALLSTVSLYYLACINLKFILGFIALALIDFFVVRMPDLKWLKMFAIFLNIFFLACFKYIFPETSNVLIPLGLSIFVFQQIAILVESQNIYSQNISIHQFFSLSFFWGNFATGPIVSGETFNEFTRPILLSSKDITKALFLALVGLFKIYVISGNLSFLTNDLYTTLHPDKNYFIPFLANKYEIYANFSGFTDLALAIGLIFGLNLPQNFNRPFQVSSIIEFWKRWHMSLTSWIRKYIFYPLLTTRLSKLGPTFLMLITFNVFALWHGIKLTYFLYAFIQVLLIALNYQWRKLYPQKKQAGLIKVLQWMFFYTILISVPGILFKSSSVEQFKAIMKTVFYFQGNFINYLIGYRDSILISATAIVAYEAFQFYSFDKFMEKIYLSPNWLRLIYFFILGAIVFFFGAFEKNINFVYSIY